MAWSNRVFGAQVDPRLKNKVKALQTYAEGDQDPQKEISAGEGNLRLKDASSTQFDGIQDLSSRTPFARMWTGVQVATDVTIEKDLKEPDEYKLKPNEFFKKGGTEVHEWVYLEGSTQVYEIGNHKYNQQAIGPNSSRTVDATDTPGYTSADIKKQDENLTTNVQRGLTPKLGETDGNQYFSAPAGITSVKSETEGPLGVIKKVTVEFQIHNFSDFENIFMRYFLRPGAQIFIDMGWDTALLYDTQALMEKTTMEQEASMPYEYKFITHLPGVWALPSIVHTAEMYSPIPNIEDILFGPNGYVPNSNGDMETMVGHVSDYSATARTDGGFDCSVEILSKNSSLVSTQLTKAFKSRVKKGLDIEVLSLAISDSFQDESLYAKAKQWGGNDQVATQTNDEILQALKTAAAETIGGRGLMLPGQGWHGDKANKANNYIGVNQRQYEAAQNTMRTGIFFGGNKGHDLQIYINFGFFEDKILNAELGFAVNAETMAGSPGSGGQRDPREANLIAHFNSRNSFITLNKHLYRAMENRQEGKQADLLYPFIDPNPKGVGGGDQLVKLANSMGIDDNTKDWTSGRFPCYAYLDTYNAIRGKLPDSPSNIDYSAGGANPTLADEAKNRGTHIRIYPKTDTEKITWEYIDTNREAKTKTVEYTKEYGQRIAAVDDMNRNRIPLRECFIRLEKVKELVESSTTVSDLINGLCDAINEATGNITDLTLGSNSYGSHTMAFVDKNVIEAIGNAEDYNYIPTSNADKDPNVSYPREDFLERLLTFTPYSKNSIVKSMGLSYEMPSGNMGNMLAIQSTGTTQMKNSRHINTVLSGIVAHEEIERFRTDEKSRNMYVKWLPKIGDEAGRRLQKNLRGLDQSFDFAENDIVYMEKIQKPVKPAAQQPFLQTYFDPTDEDQTRDANMVYNDELYYGSAGSAVSSYYKAGMYGPGQNINQLMARAADPDMTLQGKDPEEIPATSDEDDYKADQELAEIQNQELCNTIWDVHLANARNESGKRTLPLTEAKLSLTVYGLSGFLPGDLITCDYLPSQYFNSCFFQVMSVQHELDAAVWNTTLEAQMRILPTMKVGETSEFEVPDVVVAKSSIVNMSGGKDIGEAASFKMITRYFGNAHYVDISDFFKPEVYMHHEFEIDKIWWLKVERKKPEAGYLALDKDQWYDWNQKWYMYFDIPSWGPIDLLVDKESSMKRVQRAAEKFRDAYNKIFTHYLQAELTHNQFGTNWSFYLNFYRENLAEGDTFYIVQSPKKNFFLVPRSKGAHPGGDTSWATGLNYLGEVVGSEEDWVDTGPQAEEFLKGDKFIKKHWKSISRLFRYGVEHYIDPNKEK